jgi:membrane-associated phospholipid phosphatase
MVNSNNNLKYFLAEKISYVFEAPLIAIIPFLIFNFYLNPENFLQVESISLLFATISPIFLIITWSKLKKIDRDYTIKETRNYPLLIMVIIYFIGSLILWVMKANPLSISLMLCYAFNTLIVFFINLKWKISVHSMGISGPTTAILFFSPLGFILGLLGPIVMWSRTTLKKHTTKQVLAGSILGYVLTFIQIYFLLNIMDFTINIDPILIIGIIIALLVIQLIFYLKGYLDNDNIK